MTTPVVLAPIAPDAPRTGRGHVAATRDAQARALARSAGLAGAPVPDRFPRDASGAPARFGPGDAWHWSAANTRGASVAAVAATALGVDIESLTRPRVPAPDAFADAEEVAHLGATDTAAALTLWCAKEAVLKLTLEGIRALRACRLIAPAAADSRGAVLPLELEGRRYHVRVVSDGGYLIALAVDGGAEAAPDLALCRLAPSAPVDRPIAAVPSRTTTTEVRP